MRRTALLSLLTACVLAGGLLAPSPSEAAIASGAGIFVGACPLAGFTLTGTSGPVNRLPGPMSLSLVANGSLCAVNLDTRATVTVNANLSSSSFGCFSGVATGTGTFSASDAGTVTNVFVILVNTGGTWTIVLDGLPTFSGVAAGVSFPIGCSLGTPAPSLTAVGSLAFEDPELSG